MINRFLQRLRMRRDHKWVKAHSSEYIDAELSPAERRRVDEHVGICPECRHFVRQLVATVKMIAGLKKEEPPPERISERVIDRLHSER